MAFDFGSLIGGLAGVASNIYTNERNISMQRETNEHNKKLMELQNQWNVDQWNRENAYNDPSRQMARLEAAGINPNLAFANGSLMNEAAASPQMQAAQEVAPSMQSPVDPLVVAQIKNLNAQTDETLSKIPVNKKMANKIEEEAKKIDQEIAGLQMDYFKNCSTALSEIAAKNASNRLTQKEAVEKTKYVAENAKRQYEILEQQLENLKKEGKIKDEEFNKAVELTRGAKAEADKLAAEADIAQYAAKFKGFEYWSNKVFQFGKLIVEVISVCKQFNIPIPDAGNSDYSGFNTTAS